MKRFAAVGIVAFLLLTTTGCNRGDSVMKELIGHINELAVSFEKRQPPEKQQAIFAKVETTSDKFESLKLSKEDKEKLKQRYGAEARLASKRLYSAMAKAGVNPQNNAMLLKCVDAMTSMTGEKDAKSGGR